MYMKITLVAQPSGLEVPTALRAGRAKQTQHIRKSWKCALTLWLCPFSGTTSCLWRASLPQETSVIRQVIKRQKAREGNRIRDPALIRKGKFSDPLQEQQAPSGVETDHTSQAHTEGPGSLPRSLHERRPGRVTVTRKVCDCLTVLSRHCLWVAWTLCSVASCLCSVRQLLGMSDDPNTALISQSPSPRGKRACSLGTASYRDSDAHHGLAMNLPPVGWREEDFLSNG